MHIHRRCYLYIYLSKIFVRKLILFLVTCGLFLLLLGLGLILLYSCHQDQHTIVRPLIVIGEQLFWHRFLYLSYEWSCPCDHGFMSVTVSTVRLCHWHPIFTFSFSPDFLVQIYKYLIQIKYLHRSSAHRSQLIHDDVFHWDMYQVPVSHYQYSVSSLLKVSMSL